MLRSPISSLVIAVVAWSFAPPSPVAAQDVAIAPTDDAEIETRPIDAATVRIVAVTGWRVQPVVIRQQGEARAFVAPHPRVGHGSGVVVRADGLVLTARHVVADASLLMVMLADDDSARPARVVYEDPDLDVAFVRYDGPAPPHVDLDARRRRSRVGQPVFASGFPLDVAERHPALATGILSRTTNDGLLELAMAVNPGNSGGPVTDADDHLLGIVSQGANVDAGAQGFARAVPVDAIRRIYERSVQALPTEAPSASSGETLALGLLRDIVLHRRLDRVERRSDATAEAPREDLDPESQEDSAFDDSAMSRVLQDPSLLERAIFAAETPPGSVLLLSAIARYRAIVGTDLRDRPLWMQLARRAALEAQRRTRGTPLFVAMPTEQRLVGRCRLGQDGRCATRTSSGGVYGGGVQETYVGPRDRWRGSRVTAPRVARRRVGFPDIYMHVTGGLIYRGDVAYFDGGFGGTGVHVPIALVESAELRLSTLLGAEGAFGGSAGSPFGRVSFVGGLRLDVGPPRVHFTAYAAWLPGIVAGEDVQNVATAGAWTLGAGITWFGFGLGLRFSDTRPQEGTSMQSLQLVVEFNLGSTERVEKPRWGEADPAPMAEGTSDAHPVPDTAPAPSGSIPEPPSSYDSSAPTAPATVTP